MMATALGSAPSAVRDVRRSFRQACWVAVVHLARQLGGAVERRADHPARSARSRRWRATRRLFLRGYMWSILPFLLFQAMRNFLSALERPRWIFIVSAAGHRRSTPASAGR